MQVIVIGMIVDMDKRTILMGKRKTPPVENGLYGFPGGKVKEGERLHIAMARELYEEVGIQTIKMDFFSHMEVFIPDIGHLIEFFYLITKWEGEIQNVEPDKCEGWEFHPLDTYHWPEPLAHTLKVFRSELANKLMGAYYDRLGIDHRRY